MPRPLPPAPADRESLSRRFDIEARLAQRIRAASKEERQALYTEVYDELFLALGVQAEPESRAFQTELEHQLLAPFLEPTSVVVEIGSGDAALALRIAPEVTRVHAVEASSHTTPEIRTSFPPNLHLLSSERTAAAIPHASVDLAYSCHFVEHLHPDDLPAHLLQVLDWLRPGGVYVLVTPNRLYGPHDISGYFCDHPQGLHLKEYTHLELARCLKHSGFTGVAALRGIGRPPTAGKLLTRAAAEALIAILPRPIRRSLFDRWDLLARRRPFRPLEQVRLLARK